ncbi:MAG: sigma-54 dependent transcriptional regulator, partial [Candidatus Margulisbacteria bacterium]|nr:sigma-54 dependent transcriptional regulator [Candidatus Margulisiibacteriota bacterium]
MTAPKPAILAVDDEADMRQTYKSILQNKYKVTTASSGKDAVKIIQAEAISLVLLDIRMPGQDGIETLKQIKAQDPETEVIMVSASKDIASAVEAMKLGAFDYVTKPFDVKELLILIEKVLEKISLVKENLYLKDSLAQATTYCDLIGQTPQMQNLFQTIEKVAPTDSTVLIHGESGTGKELVARAIHKKSQRADQPFIALNCAAIPENLFESELFGHERGSFTGALERKLGKFELADGGSLFLDEIGCMPPGVQARLLRVLQDNMIERVGGGKPFQVDVRVVAATNLEMKEAIANKKFREDLYYRLNVLRMHLPPLRERKGDIALLLRSFLDKFNKDLKKSIKGFDPTAIELLTNYNWPGNVREL